MASAAAHSELQLLFACARLSPGMEQVRSLAAHGIDWHRLASAAEYHGIVPLLVRNLQAANVSIPSDVANELERWNAATIRQNLFLTSELFRVHAALKERGIEAIPLKGPALAAELYRDLGLRPFSDLDLLISREQVHAAEIAVKELGYEGEFAIPPQHRERWLKQQCELSFRRAGATRLELHWDIAHPHFAHDTGVDGFWARLTTVQIGDTILPNFSPRDLLFTLIVHGTRHAWSRIMWLVDVAELLRKEPAIDWEEFWRNANLRGAARMMATGLVLVRRVFGVSVSNAATERAYSDEAALTLADQVIAHWSGSLKQAKNSDLEPTALWRHRWIIRTKENRSQRLVYRRRVMMMIGDEEFSLVRLPRLLAPLYNVVRFWNIFRRARPRARTASAQSKD
jgi:hypothetical protein